MPGEIRVTFTDNITEITLTNTLLFFEDDTGKIQQIFCETSKFSNHAVSLTRFRDAAMTSVDLARGGGVIPAVPPGKTRTYNIVLKGVKLTREPRPRPIQTSVDVNSVTNKAPRLTVARIHQPGGVPYNRRIIHIHPEGIAPNTFISKFQQDPGKVRISYTFASDDLSPMSKHRLPVSRLILKIQRSC